MKKMAIKQMKINRNELKVKEGLLKDSIDNYQKTISSLLGDIKGIGATLDVTSTKEALIRLQNEKNKLESDLIAIRFEIGVLTAKINRRFYVLLGDNSIEGFFQALNEKYASYAIPIQFEYQYDEENDNAKNVVFYKV